MLQPELVPAGFIHPFSADNLSIESAARRKILRTHSSGFRSPPLIGMRIKNLILPHNDEGLPEQSKGKFKSYIYNIKMLF